MATAAEKVRELPMIRKFDTADLTSHGGWIVKRMARVMNKPEALIASWVQSCLNSREYLFLWQPHACALAQIVFTDTLTGRPIVREKFVFAQEGHAAEAAQFYIEFRNWAKSFEADVIVVEEMSDVPHDMIKEVLGGRLFTKQQIFVKL